MNQEIVERELTDIELLDQVGRTFLESDYERETWCVRPGVTFQGIEVILGERVYAIPLGGIHARRQTGQLETYALKLIADLRSKRSIVRCTACGASREFYRRLDVVHEIHKALWDAIKDTGRLQLGICQNVADYQREITLMQDYIADSLREAEKTETILDRPIDALKVNGWVMKALRNHGIKTIREICALTKAQILEIPDMGKRALTNLQMEFERLGLEFAQEKESLESDALN